MRMCSLVTFSAFERHLAAFFHLNIPTLILVVDVTPVFYSLIGLFSIHEK